LSPEVCLLKSGRLGMRCEGKELHGLVKAPLFAGRIINDDPRRFAVY